MNNKKRIVILTGTGISSQSGISLRFSIKDANNSLILNQITHINLLQKLEEQYEVHIITQNMDDLHE